MIRQEIDVGMIAGVRAMNMTHTGELGWVLYVPNEVSREVRGHWETAAVSRGHFDCLAHATVAKDRNR